MPAPTAQPEAAATLDCGVDAMLAGASGEGAEQSEREAPTADLEGDMLAPEDFAAPPGEGDAGPEPAAALSRVAEDLAGLPSAPGGADPAVVPAGEGQDASGEAIETIEDLDKALAQIAQEQLGAVEAESEAAAGLQAAEEAARAKAALEPVGVIPSESPDPPTASEATDAQPTAEATPLAATADATPDGAGAPPAERASPSAETPAEAAAPARAGTPGAAAQERAAPSAASPASVSAAVASAAPASSGARASAETAGETASGAKARGARGPLGALLKPIAAINEPFQGLSPVATQTVSIIAIVSIFNAICLWVFLLLR